MKKSKIANIIVLSLSLLFCIISFIMAITCGDESLMNEVFSEIIFVSLTSLIVALVMVILSKKKLIMIPMLVLFSNSFYTFTLLSGALIGSTNGGNITMDAFDFAIITLAILGIVFTCLKHKWGAVVGIVGIAFMIFSQNSLIYGITALSDGSSLYKVISWAAAATLFQFVWLLVPMISLLCEKKQNEDNPQIEEQK